jgi:hypothetical protein
MSKSKSGQLHNVALHQKARAASLALWVLCKRVRCSHGANASDVLTSCAAIEFDVAARVRGVQGNVPLQEQDLEPPFHCNKAHMLLAANTSGTNMAFNPF